MAVYDSVVRHGTISMVTASLGINDPQVGQRCREGDEEYVFVYNAGNSQISPAYFATVSAVSGYSVTVSMTAAIDFAVGLCKHATLTTGTYGWLMTKGFAEVKMGANASIAAGGILVPGADGVADNKSLSTGFPVPAIGKAMAAIASGASGTAFISIF
jgi:hypothetical protein